MSDPERVEDEPQKKASKKPLLLGLGLAAICGGAAYYAVNTGIVLGNGDAAADTSAYLEEVEPVTFVSLQPIVVSVGQTGDLRLRFQAELEVEPTKRGDVENLSPRILDVLNGYLRAVDVDQLRKPTALVKLRAQMLRRIQLVTGEGHVRDLLITEFVLT